MPPAPGSPVVGLVLSGGGARASFQVGALRYLYDEVGITPSVITGTSAGSILAAVLAQSADHTGQRASLARLEELFRGMTDSSDMFEELPWFTRLRERGPELMEALERRHRRQGTLGRSFRRVADLRHGITVAAERVKAANGARPDDAAAEEEPVEAARRADAAAATAPPTKLTPDGTGPSGGGLPGEPAASPAPSAGRARTSGRSSVASAASGRCSVPAVSWTASWNPTSSTRRRWRARGSRCASPSWPWRAASCGTSPSPAPSSSGRTAR